MGESKSPATCTFRHLESWTVDCLSDLHIHDNRLAGYVVYCSTIQFRAQMTYSLITYYVPWSLPNTAKIVRVVVVSVASSDHFSAAAAASWTTTVLGTTRLRPSDAPTLYSNRRCNLIPHPSQFNTMDLLLVTMEKRHGRLELHCAVQHGQYQGSEIVWHILKQPHTQCLHRNSIMTVMRP